MNQATQVDSDRSVRGAGLKFAHAGGSRPLVGYTIKRGVGRGGFGEVYYAVSDAGKEVALKLIRRNLDVELRGVTHCLNLKHPNLLSLFDVKQDDEENSWVVMEYVAGESLEEVIGRHPNGMPADQVVQWMHGIAAGVAYLHDHGIVHRDLKPGNIFLDEGIVKLGDYGLSKFISCSRRSGQTESVGTVHYMAPEVANGRYGKEIDVYALGIILYEMLTGRVPFEGESIGEVLMKHLTAEPDVSQLAEPFRSVVAKALAKDPLVRTRSVAELLAGLPAPNQPPAGVPNVSTLAAASPRRAHTEAGNRGPEGGPPPPPPPFSPTADEPIAKAVLDFVAKIRLWWVTQNFNTPTKIVFAVLGIWLLAQNAFWIAPSAGMVLLVYGGYRLVRAAVLHGQVRHTQSTAGDQKPCWSEAVGPLAPAPEGDTGSPPPPPKAARPAKRRREKLEPTMILKPPRERLAELAGSLLMSAGVVATLSLIMLLVHGDAPRVELYAWLSLCSLAGSWLVLLPSKLWEGRAGEAVLRRFTMLVLGLGLGGFAFVLRDALMVQITPTPGRPRIRSLLEELEIVRDYSWTSRFFAADGSPTIYAFLGFFATLFLLVRWWRQADPLRNSRLSLWATGWTVLAAYIAAHLWPFPEYWSMAVAAIISVAVQLTSPWLPREQRQFATA